MTRRLPTLYATLCLLMGCAWLWGCGAWELPPLKIQRNCDKPGAKIVVDANQLQVKLSLGETHDIDSVRWDFGDGTTTGAKAQTSVTRTYTTPNTYTVSATLINACGEQIPISQVVRVTNVVKPSIVTLEDLELSYTTARVRVQLVSTGNAPITRYGICWSATSTSPSIENGDSNTVGMVPTPSVNTPIAVQLTRLQANTAYWFRAFAINAEGQIGYGLALDRRTNRYPEAAIIDVGCTADCYTTARINWRLTDPGLPLVKQYGVAYSLTNNLPEITNAQSMEADGPNAPIMLSGLLAGRSYYMRLYCQTPVGVYYAPGPATVYQTQSTLNRGMVLDLPFFDPQFNAPSLNDQSGNNNDGTQKNGSPLYTTDRKELAQRALRLQGRPNDYCYVADAPALRPDAPLSISMWFRVGTPADTMTLFSKARFADGAGDQYNCLLINPDSPTERAISVFIRPGANCPRGELGRTISAVYSIPPFAYKGWNHLVMTYGNSTGSAAVTLYLNGERLSDIRIYPTTDRLTNDCQFGELKFGGCSARTPYYFNGALDDIRLYRRELSEVEAKELANQ
ncbi:LamG-like jellyroll fold domain-containing protein [Fibrella sp. WM1]|uniref:LamG-like jellyroll fold domain-containing protein n=1 Tax=Fibrella musci TaxID=3242485 RepID=UPI003521E56D